MKLCQHVALYPQTDRLHLLSVTIKKKQKNHFHQFTHCWLERDLAPGGMKAKCYLLVDICRPQFPHWVTVQKYAHSEKHDCSCTDEKVLAPCSPQRLSVSAVCH